jgi:hypothetical protein
LGSIFAWTWYVLWWEFGLTRNTCHAKIQCTYNNI